MTSNCSIKESSKNLEAEQSVLGCIILNPDCIADIRPLLKADMFFDIKNQQIYQSALEVYDRHSSIDPIQLSEQLANDGSIVTDIDLMNVIDSVPSATNSMGYAQIVRDRYTSRQIIRQCQQIISRPTELQSIRSQLQTALDSINESDLTALDQSADMNLAFNRTQSELEGKEDRQLKSISTGYLSLDTMTGGLYPGRLYVIGAVSSQGKSTLAMNIVRNVCTNGGRVAYFSTEMQLHDLLKSWLAMEGGLQPSKFNQTWLGQMSNTARSAQADRQDYLYQQTVGDWDIHVFDDESFVRDVFKIQSAVRSLNQKKKLDLVVVDHLADMRHDYGHRSLHDNMNETVAQLNSICKDQHNPVPLLLLHQVNKSVAKRENQRPYLSDLREAADLEHKAASVIFISPDRQLSEVDQDQCHKIVEFAKNRFGQKGLFKFQLIPETMTFVCKQDEMIRARLGSL